MGKTRALFVAAVVAWMAAGCTQEQLAQWSWPTRRQASPEATAQTLVPQESPKEAADGQSPDEAPADDTTDAVLEYVNELEALSQGDQQTADDPAGDSSDPRSEPAVPSPTDARRPVQHGHASPAPGQPDSDTPRTNRPLNLSSPETDPTIADPAGRLVPPRILSVSAATSDPLKTEPPRTAAVGPNQGLDTALPEKEESLHRLIEQARKELANDPANVRKQWRLMLLRLAAGEAADATEFSQEITREQRSLMSAAVASIDACGRLLTSREPNEADALTAVDSLRTLLVDQADLVIPVVALCTRVSTFGVYDEYPASALVPYQANRVIVYCEIENVTAQQGEDGYYRSSLSSRMELFSADGRSVWVKEETGIEDQSRQRRADFFLAQLVTLPPSLGPSEYVLKVAVTDLLGGNTNEAIHRFYLGTPPEE